MYAIRNLHWNKRIISFWVQKAKLPLVTSNWILEHCLTLLFPFQIRRLFMQMQDSANAMEFFKSFLRKHDWLPHYSSIFPYEWSFKNDWRENNPSFKIAPNILCNHRPFRTKSRLISYITRDNPIHTNNQTQPHTTQKQNHTPPQKSQGTSAKCQARIIPPYPRKRAAARLDAVWAASLALLSRSSEKRRRAARRVAHVRAASRCRRLYL